MRSASIRLVRTRNFGKGISPLGHEQRKLTSAGVILSHPCCWGKKLIAGGSCQASLSLVERWLLRLYCRQGSDLQRTCGLFIRDRCLSSVGGQCRSGTFSPMRPCVLAIRFVFAKHRFEAGIARVL